MKKLVAAALALVIGLALTSFAKEKEGADHKAGDKGVITGEIIKKDGPKITVKGEKETLLLFPYWRGGMPKDGGGFDKEMVAKLAPFKVGDHAKVEWTMQEHYRIDSIEKINGGDRKREEK